MAISQLLRAFFAALLASSSLSSAADSTPLLSSAAPRKAAVPIKKNTVALIEQHLHAVQSHKVATSAGSAVDGRAPLEGQPGLQAPATLPVAPVAPVAPVLPVEATTGAVGVGAMSSLLQGPDSDNSPQSPATSSAASTAATPAEAMEQVSQPVSAGQVSAPTPSPQNAALPKKQGERVKALAFGQIATLDAEFGSLRLDDQAHIRQLSFNVQLRERLRQQLHAAEEHLEDDNVQLAKRTVAIAASQPAESLQATASVAGAGGEPASAQSAQESSTDGNETVAALLQADVTSVEERDVTSEQIASDALQRVKALQSDITSLHTRDEEEVKALRSNADTRATIGQRIAAQRTQLHTDSGSLLTDLGRIRDLAAPSMAGPSSAAPKTASAAQEASGQASAASSQ